MTTPTREDTTVNMPDASTENYSSGDEADVGVESAPAAAAGSEPGSESDTGADIGEVSTKQSGPKVFLVQMEPYSSNQGQSLALAQGLYAEGWDVHIVCRASSWLANAARERSLPVHTLADDAGKGFFTAWKLVRIVRRQGVKKQERGLLHACDTTASHVVAQAWRLDKKLRIVHTRRMPIMEPNPKAVRCYQVPPAKVITDSLAGKIALRLSGIEPHLLHTIPCGIDPSEQATRRERGDGRIVFAVTGALLVLGGHSFLFDALTRLENIPDLPPWEVRILGDGPYFQALLDDARAKNVAGRLAFLGGAGAGAQLCDCDILVLPASEGESHVPLILQGWAAGLPVVAMNRLDHAEVFQEETNCLLAQPGDAASLASHMARLAVDRELRGHLAAGGRASLPKFSFRQMVLEHKRLFGQILA